ncbi:MAG: hypothetical protein MHMPM18_000221 [Marteilia pararefringens]
MIFDSIQQHLITLIRNSVSYSLYLDYSTDINDESQLIVRIRIVSPNLSVIDEILDVKPLGIMTESSVILKALKDILNHY